MTLILKEPGHRQLLPCSANGHRVVSFDRRGKSKQRVALSPH